MKSRNFFETNPRKTIAFVVGFLIFFLCVIAEVVLRITKKEDSISRMYDYSGSFEKYYANRVFFVENEIGEKVKVKTDKYGFRNDDSVYNTHKKKIIVLGDSYIASLNTPEEKTVSGLLNARDTEYSYINAGIGGYSNFQELQALNYLLSLGVSPTKVICFIYMGNDLRDNYMARKSIEDFEASQKKGTLDGATSQTKTGLKQWVKKIAKKSELVELMYSLFSKSANDEFASYFYGEAELYKNRPDKQYYNAAKAATTSVMESFKKIAKSNKFDISFILIPSKTQIYGEFSLLPKYNITKKADEYLLEMIKSGYDIEHIRTEFSEILTTEQLSLVDLSAPFKESISKGERIYYNIDSHWNDIGQQLAAKIVYDSIIHKY